MLKKILTRALALCSCTAIAVTAGISASAATLKTDFPGAKIPTQKNYTWYSLGEVSGTEQLSKYFVIHTSAGEHGEDLYISIPEEGGFRFQSLHELQKSAGITEPEKSAAGLFEPASLKDISYTSDSGATVMKGTDGTILRFAEKSGGFELSICTDAGKKIVSLTNEQISYAYNRKGEIVRSMVEMPLADKEAIYGGGERFNGANQVGSTISLTNVDCWSLPEYSYNNVPLFHSNRGYSIWFNMYYVGQADIGDTNKNKYSVTFDGSKLDFNMWQGMPLDNLKKYTAITGTSGLSETWSFGFWTGAQYAAFSGTRLCNPFANLQELIEGYKDNYNFYPDACFAEGAVARMSQTNTYLNQRNIKTLGWFSPDLWKDLDSIDSHLPNHSELPSVDSNGTITDSGQPFVYDTTFFKNYGIYRFANKNYIDFSNPSAVDLITSCWKKYWSWGVSGTMDDFGEWYPFKGTYYNGLKGDEMHNLVSYYYAQAADKAWTEAKGGDFVLFMRSGCAGSQYYSGNFLGDNASEYNPEDGNGYNAVIKALISMGASGFNLYGADLGGLGGTPSNDLWNRWVSLSVFSPYMRQHGSVIHMPWEYGMLAKNNFGKMYYLRKNLVPMIESAAIAAEKTSTPIIQGMMVAYPYQLSLVKADTQYMFCDDLLICPVTEENAYYQQVSLPKGSTWYELNTYKEYGGGNTITAEAPTSDFPVYVKGGSVKPIQLPQSMKLGEEIHDNSKDEYEGIKSLLITPPDSDRTTTFYVKNGKSTDYHTYESSTETYTNARTSGNSFTVSNSEGSSRNIVLALGVTASSVTVDGTKLSRLAHTPSYENKEYGYYVDLNGMTTVYLPEGWKNLEIVKGDSGHVALKLSATDDADVKNMIDGNVTTSYTLPNSTGQYTTVKLPSVKTIEEISVKWAVGFSNTYDIEYSADGKDWNVILQNSDDAHTVSNGGGSYDTISFSPVKAQYLRLRTVEKGDAGNAAIYSFEAFASETSDEIEAADSEDNKWSDYNPNEYDEEVVWIDGEDQTIETVTRKKKSVPITKISVAAVVILIVSILLAVLLITGLVIFLVIRKKKKAAALNNIIGNSPNISDKKNE